MRRSLPEERGENPNKGMQGTESKGVGEDPGEAGVEDRRMPSYCEMKIYQCIMVKSLCCIDEPNIMLCINYISIKK